MEKGRCNESSLLQLESSDASCHITTTMASHFIFFDLHTSQLGPVLCLLHFEEAMTLAPVMFMGNESSLESSFADVEGEFATNMSLSKGDLDLDLEEELEREVPREVTREDARDEARDDTPEVAPEVVSEFVPEFGPEAAAEGGLILKLYFLEFLRSALRTETWLASGSSL